MGLRALWRNLLARDVTVCHRCYVSGTEPGWLETPSGWFCPVCAGDFTPDLLRDSIWHGTARDRERETARILRVREAKRENSEYWGRYLAWDRTHRGDGMPPPSAIPPSRDVD